MTTYGRFLEVPEVARMKSLLLWFVIYVYVRPGVVAEIELYSDVTDDYSLDQLSYYMRSQQRRQALLEQRQQQLAEAEEAFGRDELEAAAEAAAVVAAAEARGGGAGDGPAQQKQRLPFERGWSGMPPQPLGRAQQPAQQRLLPDALPGFRLGASVRQEEPAFSYREPAGQAADGEVAPFAFSPKDMRFYEDSASQVSELAGSDAYRSRDYGFRGGEEGAGVSDVDAAPADNNAWPERSSGLVQQPAQPAVPLAPAPQTAAQQPDQIQRGGTKVEGGSGSGPASGAKKTGVEPKAAAAGDSLGLGRQPQQQQQPPSAALPSRAMDREAPSRAAGPAAQGGAAPPAGPEVGNAGGGSPASDVAARAQAGADAAANAYQSARGHKVVMENEDEEVEAVQSPGVQSDFMSGQIKQKHMSVNSSDVYFIAIVAGCCAAAAVGIVGVGISWYRRKHRDNRDHEGGIRWSDSRKGPTNVHYQRGSANAFKAVPVSYLQPTSSGEMSHSGEGLRNALRLQKNAKAAADVEYPAYGVTGPKQDISPTSGDRRLAQSAQMYHYQHQKQQIIAMERPRVMPVANTRGFSDQMFREYERRDETRPSKEGEGPRDVPWETHPGAHPGAGTGASASEEEHSGEERRRARAAGEEGRPDHKSTSLDRKVSYDRSPTGTPTRSSVTIAAQKLDSVRGSAQMRRVIKGMNYTPKPRSSSLPDEIQRLSRTYSVPTRSNEMKDHELTPEESKRKSIEIQRTIRKTMPVATQRLEDSTRRAVEYLEERHKTSLAGTESKVRRPQPPEPVKPQERITRRRRPTTPTQK